MKLLLGVYGMQEADAREFVKMANEMGADIKSYALRFQRHWKQKVLMRLEILKESLILKMILQ